MPPLLQFATDLLLFVLVVAGLGVPLLASCGGLDPLERFVAGIGAGLLVVYGWAFAVFVFGLPPLLFAALPAAALALCIARRRALRTLATSEAVAPAAGLWALVSLWCVGFALLVQSYSGGGWSGDWMEHYERALFFLQRQPLDTRFIQTYPLTARPPLANLVTGALLGLGSPTFARYQLFSCLLNALAFLPALLLARDLGAGRRGFAGLALLLMLNPLFVQNTTFAWTKLFTAFFVLLAAHFLLRDVRGLGGRLSVPLAGAALASGALAHYSAGVWILALGASWLLARPDRLRDAALRRNLLAGSACGTLILATWFGWSLQAYGMHATFGTTTSVTAARQQTAAQLTDTVLGNIADTLVPHAWRTMDRSLIEQADQAAMLRDWFFNVYQLNLPMAAGTAGAAWFLVLGLRSSAFRGSAAVHPPRSMPRGEARFLAFAVVLAIVLGAGTHTIRDQWGLTHISLQPLVLLALAALAARALPWLETAPPMARATVALAVAVDFGLGVVLHFGVQSFFIGHLLHPDLDLLQLAGRLNQAARGNFWGMVRLRSPYLGEALDLPQPLVAALLVTLFVAVWRLARPRRAVTAQV